MIESAAHANIMSDQICSILGCVYGLCNFLDNNGRTLLLQSPYIDPRTLQNHVSQSQDHVLEVTADKPDISLSSLSQPEAKSASCMANEPVPDLYNASS